jgi:DNA-binding NtrC family response regulator
VRELENAVERAVILAQGSRIQVEDLPPDVGGAAHGFPPIPSGTPLPLEDVEKAYILSVLAGMKGDRTRTAQILRIGRNTLWRKLRAFGVPGEQAPVQAAEPGTARSARGTPRSSPRSK